MKCFCCGTDKHLANTCDKRNKIPREDWWDKKTGHVHVNKAVDTSDETDEIKGEYEWNEKGELQFFQFLNIGATFMQDTKKIQNNNLISDMTHIEKKLKSNQFDPNDMKHYLLLDNQSTLDIFCKKSLLSNVQECGKTMTVITNGGGLSTNLMGGLANYKDVWFDERAVTNILSLYNVKQHGYRVFYDSNLEDAFIVEKPNGDIFKFTPSPDGLYYLDTRTQGINMLNTVEDNKIQYSKRDLKRASEARSTYRKICTPSVSDFKQMIRVGGINNCPVTLKDVHIAEDVYGPSISALKSKTKRTSPSPVIHDSIQVPKFLTALQKEVIVDVDIFFVNKMPFLGSVSQNIVLTTTEWLPNQKEDTLAKACANICVLYKKYGFRVTTMNLDNQFRNTVIDAAISEHQCEMNYCAASEHVPRIERRIQVIKERVRGMMVTLDNVYPKLPKDMVRALIKEVTKWINVFSTKE